MILGDNMAALIIFPIAFIGVLANWTVVFLVRRLPSLRNSFGRLTVAQAIVDAVNSTIYAFYVAPMIIFDIRILKSVSTVFGHVLLDFYDISICSHLCISFNRFCSIVIPMKYSKVFSNSNTNIIIFLTWTSVIFPSFYLYIYLDCRMFYDEPTYIFQYLNTPICRKIAWYAGYIKYTTIVVLIVIIDLITVLRVRSYKVKMSRSFSQANTTKSRAEMNFLKQACLQGLVFVCELFGAFVIKPHFDPTDKWPPFLLTTVTWVSVHTFDGVITLIFNREFAQIMFSDSNIRVSSNNATRNNTNLFIAGSSTTIKS